MVFVFLLSCTTSAQEKKNPIEGTWELVSAKWTSPDTTSLFPITDHDRQIKMISRSHFVWISQDTSRKDVNGFGGGKYTLDGDKYTEHIEIFYDPRGIGKSFTFKMKVEGDTLIQSGTMPFKKLGLISFMTEKDIYWIPTLELWKGVSEMYSINWIDIAESNLQRFVQAGGKVALGTDYDGYITPFELGMPITEIKLMQEAGMTPMDIIVAGTKHAAHVCDHGYDLGTIEPGKIADIIVVNDNPLDDLEALLNIQIVIKDGKIITNSKQ